MATETMGHPRNKCHKPNKNTVCQCHSAPIKSTFPPFIKNLKIYFGFVRFFALFFALRFFFSSCQTCKGSSYLRWAKRQFAGTDRSEKRKEKKKERSSISPNSMGHISCICSASSLRVFCFGSERSARKIPFIRRYQEIFYFRFVRRRERIVYL